MRRTRDNYPCCYAFFAVLFGVLRAVCILIWLIFGNIWFFQSQECSDNFKTPICLYSSILLFTLFWSYVFKFGSFFILCTIIGILGSCFKIFQYPLKRLQQYRANQMLTAHIYNITGNTEITCSICLDIFNPGENVCKLPCNHEFHKSCIDPWIAANHATCPMCRHDMTQQIV